MIGLIKLIVVLFLLTGLAVYGGQIWDTIKEKVLGYTDPELQKATLLDSFKRNFSEVENLVREVNENLDNPSFDKKARLEESLKKLEETKTNFEKIEKSDESLVEKTFENLKDLKEGVQALISPQSKNEKTTTGSTQDCQCSLEK